MNPPALIFATAALIPAMTATSEGTPQMAGPAALALALCNGGNMVLTLGSGQPQPASPCCCAKGCRGDKRRPRPRRIDRKQ